MAVTARPAEVFERGDELQQIALLTERLAKGRGGLLAIEGSTGIGKTTLLQAAVDMASGGGLRVLRARGSELERDYGFGVARQWLEGVLAGAGESERALLLEGAAALAAPAVVPESEPPEGPASHAVLHGLYWLIANLSAQAPVLLALDDAQWSDEASLRLILHLTARLDGVAAAVLLTCRSPGDDPAGLLLSRLLTDPGWTVLRPKGLGGEATAALLTNRMAVDADAEFAEACVSATGGNPFYLEALAEALSADGVAPVAGNAKLVSGAEPDELARALLARLTPQARQLAETLAVLEAGEDPSLAPEVAGLPAGDAVEAHGELVRAGLITDRRPPAFVHAILRNAVLSGMSAAERAAKHARAGRVLRDRGAPVEQIAVHLAAAEPRGDPETIATLREAAFTARSRAAPEVAARLLVRALDEPVRASDRADVLLDLALAEHAADLPTAAAHIEQALALVHDHADPMIRGRVLRAYGWVRGTGLSPSPEAVALMDQTAAELTDVDHELALRLEFMATTALIVMPGGREEAGRRLAAYRDLPGTTPNECLMLAALSRNLQDSGAPADEVAAVAVRAARLDTLREIGPDSPWLVFCAVSLLQSEHFDEVDTLLEAAVDLARARGIAAAYALAIGQRSRLAYRRGQLREAEADAREGFDTNPGGGWYRYSSTALLMDALVQQGRLDEAQAAYNLLGAGDELPDARPATVALVSRGILRHAQGHHQAALADLLEARRRIELFAVPNAMGIDGRLHVAALYLELGDRDRALEEAAETTRIARAWGAPGTIGQALHAHGLVIGGDDGFALLQEAVSQLGASQLRLEHARALVDLGAAMRRRGARADARVPIREGLAIAERCGARPVAEQARAELAATGVRVPREGARHRLTPSELRIANMAAGGASNPQIAQALFVTTKTVETHLSNAYRKLDVSSRQDLPGALAALID